MVASRSGVLRFSSANSLKPEIPDPSQTPFPTHHDCASGSEPRILTETAQLAQESMTCSSAGLTFIRSPAEIDNTRVRSCQAQNVAACCNHPIFDMLSLNIVVLVSDVTSFNSPPCAKAISWQRLKPSPAPPDCRSRDSLARKKRSNIRVCISTGITSLELEIEKIALLPSRCSLARIQPLLMLWFTALSKRLGAILSDPVGSESLPPRQ